MLEQHNGLGWQRVTGDFDSLLESHPDIPIRQRQAGSGLIERVSDPRHGLVYPKGGLT